MLSQIQFMCFYKKVEYTGICKKRNLQEIRKKQKTGTKTGWIKMYTRNLSVIDFVR